jgi:AcrR family transcriptional regulator
MNATQQQIADAFERHVAQHGYDGTTLDDIARELKISKKTIYVHFESKRDIYAQVVERQARRMKTELAASVALLPTYAARVQEAVRSVLEVGRAHIAATEREEWLHEYEIAADAFRAANGELLRELVQSGMNAGEFRAGDAWLAERMVTAMVVEYLVLVHADPSLDRDAELLERIIGFIR